MDIRPIRPIRPIRTDEDYRAALAEVAALLGASHDAPASARLEALVRAAEAYEDRARPLPTPALVEAILFYLEVRGPP